MIRGAIRVTFPPGVVAPAQKHCGIANEGKFKSYHNRNRIRASPLAYKAAQKQSSNYFFTGVELECYHEINQGTTLRTLRLVERILPAIAHHFAWEKMFYSARRLPNSSWTWAESCRSRTVLQYDSTARWFIAS